MCYTFSYNQTLDEHSIFAVANEKRTVGYAISDKGFNFEHATKDGNIR